MAELQGNSVINFLGNADTMFYTDCINFAFLLQCIIS